MNMNRKEYERRASAVLKLAERLNDKVNDARWHMKRAAELMSDADNMSIDLHADLRNLLDAEEDGGGHDD